MHIGCEYTRQEIVGTILDKVHYAFLRPIFTLENKHRIGLDFFPSCIIRSAGLKKFNLKILQLFIIRAEDHRFKLEQKIGTESPCADSILF